MMNKKSEDKDLTHMSSALNIPESDFLLIHIGKELQNKYEILLMPFGFPALANLLTENDIRTYILNWSVVHLHYPDSNLIEIIRKSSAKAIGFDLHWHFQSNSVINAIKEIKKALPDIPVIIGGYTATYFADEIISDYPEVDFVILADSEKPLLDLLLVLKRKGFIKKGLMFKNNNELFNIPNLVFRYGEDIVRNKLSYCLPQNELDRLNYGNLDLIIDKHAVLAGIWRSQGSRDFIGSIEKSEYKIFYNIGRGCQNNCTFCSGANQYQVKQHLRKNIIIKSKESAVKDFKAFINHEVKYWHTCFDPLPERNYYIDLFNALIENRIALNSHFELFSLPSKQFVSLFKETFLEDSVLILSPDSGSRRIRKLLKNENYSNKELIAFLEYCFTKNIMVELYFSSGFPFEDKNDFTKTLMFIKYIKENFPFRISVFPIELEPGSPQFCNPKYFNIVIHRKYFRDFINAHKQHSRLGYHTENFDEDEILSNISILQNYAATKEY